jgi:hypothetical protein
MLEVLYLMLVDYIPVSKVPMTLTAKRATLSDFGNAYWIHKCESNWIANIYNEKSVCYSFLKKILSIKSYKDFI